jgi:thioredoxin reductase (NADPH)
MSDSPVIIIGAGPAGVACAVQLKRYGIDFSLIESGPVGGLLHNANLVENYPGFSKGIEGGRLAGLLKQQLERLAIPVIMETVELVDRERMFRVQTNKHEYSADTLVLATGTKPVALPIQLPGVLRNKVYYEVAGLKDIDNHNISIVGGGDAAYDYALNLAARGNKVTINIRSQISKCLPLLANRAAEHKKILVRYGHSLESIELDSQELILQWRTPGGQVLDHADFLLAAIGRVPNLDYLSTELKAGLPELEDSKRLFRAGDLVNGIYRQTAIAAGDGVRIAMQIAENRRANHKCK